MLERLSPHLAQIKVLHRVFCTGVAEVPPATPNVVRASHLLNTLYKAIIEYDSVGEASEQAVSTRRGILSHGGNLVEGNKRICSLCLPGGVVVLPVDGDGPAVFGDRRRVDRSRPSV